MISGWPIFRPTSEQVEFTLTLMDEERSGEERKRVARALREKYELPVLNMLAIYYEAKRALEGTARPFKR